MSNVIPDNAINIALIAQVTRTYTAEQLVAAFYWLAGKVQEKTG